MNEFLYFTRPNFGLGLEYDKYANTLYVYDTFAKKALDPITLILKPEYNFSDSKTLQAAKSLFVFKWKDEKCVRTFRLDDLIGGQPTVTELPSLAKSMKNFAVAIS